MLRGGAIIYTRIKKWAQLVEPLLNALVEPLLNACFQGLITSPYLTMNCCKKTHTQVHAIIIEFKSKSKMSSI